MGGRGAGFKDWRMMSWSERLKANKKRALKDYENIDNLKLKRPTKKEEEELKRARIPLWSEEQFGGNALIMRSPNNITYRLEKTGTPTLIKEVSKTKEIIVAKGKNEVENYFVKANLKVIRRRRG